jgi:hypothetical protein
MPSDSSSSSDVEMFSATSGRTRYGTAADTDHQDADEPAIPNQQNTESPSKTDAGPSGIEESPASPSLDLLGRIKGMYRLLDLINEHGSGGIGINALHLIWPMTYHLLS